MFNFPLISSDELEAKIAMQEKEKKKTEQDQEIPSQCIVEQLSPNCTMEINEDTIHVTVVSESMEGVEVQPYGPGEGPNAESAVSEEVAPQPVQDLAATLQAAAAANPNSPMAVGIEAGNQRRNQPKGGGNRHRGHRISG